MILLIAALAACGIALLVIFLVRSDEGSYVQVTVNGEVYGQYSLSEDQTIEIDTEYGRNVLEIKDGEATMIEADCPDGYCMDQGSISGSTQTIVCLPNKVVVEVEGSEEESDDIDAIAN